jgi:hypothetical protein
MVERLAIASVFSVAVIVFFSYLLVTGYFVAGPADAGKPGGEAEALAACLAGKDVTIYVSKYCGACATQKEAFGDAFGLLNSVDCADEAVTCQEAGIRAVPTWVINGEIHEGVQSLERLAELAGC